MKKLYLIRTEDIFLAIPLGQLPEGSLFQSGSLWSTVCFGKTDLNNYWFPIIPISNY